MIAPQRPPPTLASVLAERGFVPCWCGATQKRTTGPWGCGRRGCSDLERGTPLVTSKRPVVERAKAKPRAGKAAEDALAELLAGPYIVEPFAVWLRNPRPEVFVRQFPVGLLLTPSRRYVADFYRCAGSLAVECKGAAHVAGAARLRRDNEREGLLVAAGIRVLPINPGDENALSLIRTAVDVAP